MTEAKTLRAVRHAVKPEQPAGRVADDDVAQPPIASRFSCENFR